MQRSLTDKYIATDFDFWVRYGSWSWCSGCQSYFFNDKFFKEKVCRELEPALVADDPVEHQPGSVGVSSRWWYLAGMYRPVHFCGRCTPPEGTSAGEALIASMRSRAEDHASGGPIAKTGELYTIPYMRREGAPFMAVSKECRTWPMYLHGVYQIVDAGESMLALSEDERRALAIIVLRTNCQQERYGAAHHSNWKKVGLSRAYYKEHALTEESMPTPKARAAFVWLQAKNPFYNVLWLFNLWKYFSWIRIFFNWSLFMVAAWKCFQVNWSVAFLLC